MEKRIRPKLVFAHGFNVRDGGADTIDTLKPYFQPDYEILEADYGFIYLLGVKLFNGNFSSLISGMTPGGSVGVGHSNGCTLLYEAAQKGAPFKRLILINPALRHDTVFPSHIEQIDVFYCSGDTAVKAASWIPGWLRGNWGAMGAGRYTIKDKRVRFHDETMLFNTNQHSQVFNKPGDLANFIRVNLDLDGMCLSCGR